MIANRENIYSALFTAVSGASADFVTVSRRLKHWNDVPQEAQPALFMVQKPETQERKRGLPAKHTLAVDIYLYVKTGEDEQTPPAPILNPLVDAIEATMVEDATTGYYHLPNSDGKTISHCWIEHIDNDEGILGSQAVAIITVRMLVV